MAMFLPAQDEYNFNGFSVASNNLRGAYYSYLNLPNTLSSNTEHFFCKKYKINEGVITNDDYTYDKIGLYPGVYSLKSSSDDSVIYAPFYKSRTTPTEYGYSVKPLTFNILSLYFLGETGLTPTAKVELSDGSVLEYDTYYPNHKPVLAGLLENNNILEVWYEGWDANPTVRSKIKSVSFSVPSLLLETTDEQPYLGGVYVYTDDDIHNIGYRTYALAKARPDWFSTQAKNDNETYIKLSNIDNTYEDFISKISGSPYYYNLSNYSLIISWY